MKKKIYSILIASFFPLLIFGQLLNINNCTSVKEGKYYFYPVTSKRIFIIERKKNVQKEINVQTSDTTFWSVNWQSNCVFTLKFMAKSKPITEEEQSFYSSNVMVFKIIKVTKSYYTFKGGADSINNANALTDTLWFKVRAN